MSRFKFVLVSRENNETTEILKGLESNPNSEVIFRDDAQGAVDILSVGEVDCLVLSFERLGEQQIRILRQVRQLGFINQILAFADETDQRAVDEVARMFGILVVEKPFSEEAVKKLCQRVMAGERIYQRKHKRHYTKQKVEIEVVKTGQKVTGIIYTLSLGGAYIETLPNTLHEGDEIKVKINLDDISKTRVLRARVVWSRLQPGSNGRINGAGIQFRAEEKRKAA